MSLREAALAVIDMFVVTDPDRTFCHGCHASQLGQTADAPMTFHKPDCVIGRLAMAVHADVHGGANG